MHLTIALVTAIIVAAVADEKEVTAFIKPVGVVYKIGSINEFKWDADHRNKISEGKSELNSGYLLIEPIPDTDNLEDGIYFRPANGKPVPKTEVCFK